MASGAGFVAHVYVAPIDLRCVRHGSCSRLLVGCHAIERERACTTSRATRQRMSLRTVRRASERLHVATEQLTSGGSLAAAPRRRTRLLPINIHGRPLAQARASPMTHVHTCTTVGSSTCTLLKATVAPIRHFSGRVPGSILTYLLTNPSILGRCQAAGARAARRHAAACRRRRVARYWPW